MKKILFVAAAFLLMNAHSAKAQDMTYNRTTYKYVHSEAGLILRAKPDINANKVASIPNKEAVLLYDLPKNAKKETINGLQGYWRKAYYKDQFGYVFDAYLKDYTTDAERKIAMQNYATQLHAVKANGGLYLRTAAGKKNTAIVLMPDNAAVLLVDTKSYGEEVIEGKKGNWRKIRYEDKIGYAFDAYLTKK